MKRRRGVVVAVVAEAVVREWKEGVKLEESAMFEGVLGWKLRRVDGVCWWWVWLGCW